MTESIQCPRCQTEIPLTEAISHQAEERLRLQFETERETFAAERERLAGEQAALLAAKDAEHQRLVERLRTEVAAAAEEHAKEQVSTELRDLAAQLEEQASARKLAEDRELALRKEKRQLEEARAALELQVERQLEEERAKIVATATERVEEAFRLKLREKELTLEQMNKRIEDLQAAADQKRSGMQGEVLEREIEDVLRDGFPADAIEPVKTGKRGADVLQRVRSGRGRECGTLLWESKNAKHWSNGWIEKLRADQQAEHADVAVIVTTALPEGVQRIGHQDGVWICDFPSAIGLALVLRRLLMSLAQADVIEANRSQALAEVYEYVCGQEFQHRVTNSVKAAVAMKEDLDAERRASERQFAKREKQIEILLRNSAGLYGELQAIVGGALLPVEVLELPPGEDEEPGALALAS